MVCLVHCFGQHSYSHIEADSQGSRKNGINMFFHHQELHLGIEDLLEVLGILWENGAHQQHTL